MNILVTGTAGFIGFYLARKLLASGHTVYGIDSINHYYDVSLKLDRLHECGIDHPAPKKEIVSARYPAYTFCQIDLCDAEAVNQLMETRHFDAVVNLAAQAGVRYSLTNPESYVQSNVVGFLNLLETSKKANCKKFIYASSSSVYGNNPSVPFKETDNVDHPISIYAATKKGNELMAFTYAHLYKLQTIGLRFFTVYGPFGRPDMAPMLFANAIRNDETIRVFNNGDLSRDFTYIDDIVTGIEKIVTTPGVIREDVPGVPATIYNIGHGSPVQLMDFVHLLEENMGRVARKEFVGMQAGDVYRTWADTTRLKEDYDYTPYTSLETGIARFARWFKEYYKK
ncbi:MULTISPECIES: NAD-dependent epimerase/dehydratase family protein [Butyricimonas]|uniref:NAD-dependent epimerase/dehydratase family protein n=1 Tax=Butyricimonas TaxID=574697 RepID=UPI001D0823B3|nr:MULTISPECIES: NAD-dependent epimerase/dehydratase family protein [Butyricimonas]MCB6971429.1 GDP-mannose 4,6-dehydratase [Butyricimonas synergistica]MCG4518143.1 GDP-mannose 4,6-dehydratase [Butyricimonas sp. DFI.6.44]